MVVDGNDESMVVVAVQDFDVDAGIGQSTTELAELARLLLIEALNEDSAARSHRHPCLFQSGASHRAVIDKEVRDAHVGDEPHASAFDADISRPQCFAHERQLAGLVGQMDFEIEHGRLPS